MQISGILVPKKRVLALDNNVKESYNAFEVELEGKVTIVIPEGQLKDDIVKAGGIGIVATLTNSGTILLSYLPYGQALTPDELEAKAKEADENEIRERAKTRESERKRQDEIRAEKLNDQARLSLTEKARLDSEKALQVTASNIQATAIGAPQTSIPDEDLKKEVERLKELATKSSKDVKSQLSPIIADIGTDDKPVGNDELFGTKESDVTENKSAQDPTKKVTRKKTLVTARSRAKTK